MALLPSSTRLNAYFRLIIRRNSTLNRVIPDVPHDPPPPRYDSVAMRSLVDGFTR